MLKCLKIEQLFGRFDYTIELQKTPITILTGPNGFGKSTILKIIDAISATNILFFYKLSFKKITVTFTDDSIFSMEQKERNGKLPDLYINGERFPVDIIVSNRIHIPWLHRVSPGEWIDFRTREKITRDQIVFHIFDSDDSVQDVLEFSEISAKDAKKYSGIIQNTKSAAQKCGNVRLISEQRLIRKERDEDDDEQIVDVISQLPKKMRAKISELTANYSKAANSLDSSYPQRLLSTEDGLSSKHEFEMKMKAANDKFAKLSKYDLVDLDFIKSVNYKDEFAKALKVYFEELEKIAMVMTSMETPNQSLQYKRHVLYDLLVDEKPLREILDKIESSGDSPYSKNINPKLFSEACAARAVELNDTDRKSVV